MEEGISKAWEEVKEPALLGDVRRSWLAWRLVLR